MLLRIGTRKSKLALWQANYVKELLQRRGFEVELVKITTSGDKILDSPLSKIGGKGLFVKEIENALLRGEVDLAVHSCKDVPTKIPRGLKIVAITKREDPRDVLITREGKGLEDLREGAKVGTSSLRRRVQILRRRKDLRVENLRGNVDTRLRKLDEGLYDAIVLSYAGVRRMGFEGRITQVLDFIPAVGQGALAIEVREGDEKVIRAVEFLNDQRSYLEVMAERSFLEVLEGGCQVPMGALAKVLNGKVFIEGFIADLEGERFYLSREEGDLREFREVGKRLAEKLLRMGGEEVLREIF